MIWRKKGFSTLRSSGPLDWHHLWVDLNQCAPTTLTQAVVIAWPPLVTICTLSTIRIRCPCVQSRRGNARHSWSWRRNIDLFWLWLWLWLWLRFWSWRSTSFALWAWTVGLGSAPRIVFSVSAPGIRRTVRVPQARTLTTAWGRSSWGRRRSSRAWSNCRRDNGGWNSCGRRLRWGRLAFSNELDLSTIREHFAATQSITRGCFAVVSRVGVMIAEVSAIIIVAPSVLRPDHVVVVVAICRGMRIAAIGCFPCELNSAPVAGAIHVRRNMEPHRMNVPARPLRCEVPPCWVHRVD